MQKISCGISSVFIGREFSLIPLLNYFKEVEIPIEVDVSLYIVLGCDSNFEILLRNKVNELDLDSKYKNIYYIPGNLKCYNNLTWNEWEKFTRQQDPNEKHRSALINIEIALNVSKKETYVHFVDDDTIPPNNALIDLLKSHQNINNCGLSSGIYFNKTWIEPTIAVSEYESSRRIVGSYQKETWRNCSIDDLSIENYQDIGFVGNGCMLVLGEDIKKILPLSEFREQGDEIAPPDFIICRRIRRLGKIISIVPSVVAEHLDQSGKPVGLTLDYLENIKNSKGSLRFLVTHYSKYLNYKVLCNKYDKILIIIHSEIHVNIPNEIKNIDNIEIIERSIKKTCEKYKNYNKHRNILGEYKFGFYMKYVILEEIHKFVKDKSNYITYYYDSLNNVIIKISLLDSRNLKKLLNKKP